MRPTHYAPSSTSTPAPSRPAPRWAWVALIALSIASCSNDEAATGEAPFVCDQRCRDNLAARAVRESVRVGFNLLLQGGPVGEQDKAGPCPFGGKVRVEGTATTDAATGTTQVDLTWQFTACGVKRVGSKDEAYEVTIDGELTQKGKISNVAGQTTALVLASDAMKVSGQVSLPTVPVDETCPLALTQDGSQVSGKFCGRDAGFAF